MRVLNACISEHVPFELRNAAIHSNRHIFTRHHTSRSRHIPSLHAAATDISTSPSSQSTLDLNQQKREGSYEAPLVQLQANKTDPQQPSIASILPPPTPNTTSDVIVVGCGPAGLALAASLAKKGIQVTLVGHDVPFVNNYGVWVDEFKQLGLEDTLDTVWNDAVCYFKEGKEVRVGRAYGRASRQLLRERLLQQCADAGVKFVAGEVESINVPTTTTDNNNTIDQQTTTTNTNNTIKSNTWALTTIDVRTSSSQQTTPMTCKMITLASGAAAGRFLQYEPSAPSVAAQTAYGIEAEVDGYNDAYDINAMLFMDYRRHHSGLYPNTASKQKYGQHQNGGQGLWGTENEVPSFLYAMPLGGKKVFLEETCLVAKPALPFSVLKRRLHRRCEALGIKIINVDEEEWSYIPTGGPLPKANQPITAFGAAANLVHPATGYSIARSLREAPAMAAAIAVALEEQPTPTAASEFVWQALWTQEKRRQASFHVFGMELLCQLDVANTADFFETFFSLPASYWKGFLASTLSSVDLLAFAMATFVIAPVNIKAKLVGHLLRDPAGAYLLEVYLGKRSGGELVAAMSVLMMSSGVLRET